MGITLFQADIILKEHKRKPLPKQVHLLGRQTVLFDHATALSLFKSNGMAPAHANAERDSRTLGSQGHDKEYITDTTFFFMLGVEKIIAIDHSDYEGAEVILDLNQPLPAEYAATCDYIYGGSVLDNIFDPAIYIKNITRLLKPGGRLHDTNATSYRDHPYMMISPAWYLDFCVLNGFRRCTILVNEGGPAAGSSPTHVYALEPNEDDEITADLGSVCSGMASYVTVLAEKGAECEPITPTQDQYRGKGEWSHYRDSLAKLKEHSRVEYSFGAPPLSYAIRNVRGMRYLGMFGGEQEPLGDHIRIVEASYGLNQQHAEIPRVGLVPVYRGNVSGIIQHLVGGREAVDIQIDVRGITDPAPGLPKDLSVLYYYTQDHEKKICEIHIKEEAHGKLLVIPAYAKPQKTASTPDHTVPDGLRMLREQFEHSYRNYNWGIAYAVLNEALDQFPDKAYSYFATQFSGPIAQLCNQTRKGAELAGKLSRMLKDHPYMHLMYWGDTDIAQHFIRLREENIAKGLPSAFLVTQGKSASVSVANIFTSGFNLPSFAYSLVTHNIVESWLHDHLRGGACYVTHLASSPENINMLVKGGVKKMIVHVRDPRQSILSLYHHIEKYRPIMADVSWGSAMKVDESKDITVFWEVYLGMIEWIEGWMEASKRIDIHFSTFEEFVTDKDAFIEGYLDFYGAARKYFNREQALGHHEGIDHHMRKGSVDEWRSVIAPDVAERLTALIPTHIKQRFGWK